MNKEKSPERVFNFRFKEIGKSVILTTGTGDWLQTNKEELTGLLKNQYDKKLLSKLEKAGLIITEKNKNEIIGKLAVKYSFISRGTCLHIIIPTLRCNFKCVYCHASSKPLTAEGFDMDKKTARAAVDFIFQSSSYYITIEFQGGEPLLKFDIVKFIIEYAKELNKGHRKSLVFTLVTNFSAMDHEKLNFLIDNKVGICTSLDGPAALHDKNRLFQGGSYKFVEKWIKILKQEYRKRGILKTRVNALVTITKDSLPYWKEIIDEYVKLGIYDIFLRFLNQLGDARPVWKRISYTPEEFIEFWKKSMDYILDLNKKGIVIREWFSWIMTQKIMRNIEPNFFEQRSPCGAIIGQLAYNYDGDIYTCDEGRMFGEDMFKVGNVKKESYKDVLASPSSCAVVASSINDLHICDYCAYKPYCGICPVCNYAEQGSIIGNIISSARCKIYMAQFDYLFDKILHDGKARQIFNQWIDNK